MFKGRVSMLKRWSGVIVILLGAVLAWWYYPSDFRPDLPPGLPASVPIAQGEIVKSTEALFKDGKGYIIEIRSCEKYAEVVADYRDGFHRGGYETTVTDGIPGQGADDDLVTFEARKGGVTVWAEIKWNGKLTYVTTAVHMHKWILP